ncbi:hypothetical protein MMC18_000783 [Xylographa bjoerkii]|nr:hypothetical protein [Xylographa bjoerkii]
MSTIDDSNATQAPLWLGVVSIIVSLRGWMQDWAPVVGGIITSITTMYPIVRSPGRLFRWVRRPRPRSAPDTPTAEIALSPFIAAASSAHSAETPPPTAEQLAMAITRAEHAEEKVRALEVEIAELKAVAKLNAADLLKQATALEKLATAHEELATAHGLFVRVVFRE